MKKSIFYITIAASMLCAVACNDDFLERYPKSDVSPETFFKTSAELETYCRSFYSVLPSAEGMITDVCQADDIASTTVPTEFTGLRTTPGSGGGWDWSALRNINFFLENSWRCEDVTARQTYDGVARFWRAYFYFTMMQRFGDLPWYDKVIGQHDTEALMKGRDSRTFIYDKVIEDLDYAIENAPSAVDPCTVSKYTAMALKSRVGLFEGTFRKYRGYDGWQECLTDCTDAAERLMKSGVYHVHTSTASKAYGEMFLADTPFNEFILAKTYNSKLSRNHYLNLHIQGASNGHPSMPRDAFLSYLCKDGTRYTDRAGYAKEDFYQSTQNRDPRLSQTIRTQNYTYPEQSEVLQPDFNSTTTGYQIAKYVTDVTTVNGTNAIPYMRYSEVLLNLAEAKAELGTIQQADINKTINQLRGRVGMPDLVLTEANSHPDPYLAGLYTNLPAGGNQGLLLEIRRERRVELFMEGLRYYDIVRWKEGQKFTKPSRGMYIAGEGFIDFDHDGTNDLCIYSGTEPKHEGKCQYTNIASLKLSDGKSGEIIVNANIRRVWSEEKDYLYPLPLEDLQLNKNLTQNYGWDEQ